MQLESIKYSEFDGKPKEWNLDYLTLEQVNLVVGKNASGKTRALNLINNLARLLRGDQKPVFSSANFDAHFKHKDQTYQYTIGISNQAVLKEEFKHNGKKLLIRGKDGVGKIFAEQLKKDIDFQAPSSELAIAVRQDSIQHPYFEPLSEWAKSVYHYAFGTALGKDIFVAFQKKEDISKPKTVESSEQVVSIYKAGEDKFGEQFKDAIKQDLKKVGYDISDLGLAPATHIVISTPLSSEPFGLWVKEKDIAAPIEQQAISQGMFRVISLVIQLNYSIMAGKPGCILIDDIGEGLDFERSCALIELLISKIKGSPNTQLIMATNDRFVMNNIPLEMWTVLHREGSHCKVFNFKNSKEKFENFRFTGLNNFDFFSTGYLTEK